LGIGYTLGIREPGHLRSLVAYHEYGWLPEPLALKFYLSAKHPYGLPPTVKGLEMYVDMIPAGLKHVWFTEIKGSDIHIPLSSVAVAMGGHVRTGLGDNWIVQGKPIANIEYVEHFANLAECCGRGVATPQEARRMLGIKPRKDLAAAA
jgi:3-keto-5-aminohexanoate cleavage enzyme